jgi:hypothetical protein
MTGFRENDNSCPPDCAMRQGLEAENLPGPTPEKVCNTAAAMLAMAGKAIGDCPLLEVDLDE